MNSGGTGGLAPLCGFHPAGGGWIYSTGQSSLWAPLAGQGSLVDKTPSWPLRELKRPRKAKTDSEKIRSLLTPVNG